jgi:hypothetical protein
MSRAQTLIKKNIESHDLRPSDIIIERFVAWKAIVKQLVCASLAFHPNAFRGVCLNPALEQPTLKALRTSRITPPGN